jgi:predicted amidohydrolase
MATIRVAAVQMDCKLGDVPANLDTIRSKLNEAADGGAKIVAFPECALTGYGFPDRRTAAEYAQPLPGPATQAVAAVCKERNVFALFGLIEKVGDKLFNACAVVGPNGFVAGYRKIHMPCVGADRFLDPGDRPFAVHDLGGIRVGVGICFDGSFPESARVLTLLGADLICLPTNWIDSAFRNATLVGRVRAMENHVYYLSVNRVGDETGYHYFGHSSICDFTGDFLTFADHDREAVLYADLYPSAAREKKVVVCAGEYEIDRVNWRRPEMYGPLIPR